MVVRTMSNGREDRHVISYTLDAQELSVSVKGIFHQSPSKRPDESEMDDSSVDFSEAQNENANCGIQSGVHQCN